VPDESARETSGKGSSGRNAEQGADVKPVSGKLRPGVTDEVEVGAVGEKMEAF